MSKPITITEKEVLELAYDSYILLDVRTPEEYEEYNIPGALNLPLANLNKACVSTLSENKIFIVYCKSGIRSHKAVEMLRNFGYLSFNLGGIEHLSKIFIKNIRKV